MDVINLRLGNWVLYKEEPYCITNISSDKLGLLHWKHHWGDFNRPFGDTSKIVFTKIPNVSSIPLMEVLVNDTRFKPSKVQIDKRITKPGLAYTSLDNKLSVALVEDGKYVGTYLILINNKNWGIDIPIIAAAKVYNFHTFQNILRDCNVHIWFNFNRLNNE